MNPSTDLAEVTSEQIDKKTGHALLDERARELLGMSADEFLAVWDSEEINDYDHVDVMEIAILIPLAR